MGTSELALRLTEAGSVLVVICTTIFLLQSRLTRAHHLLRLGLALVCAGSVLELYQSTLHEQTGAELIASVIVNSGQAAIYLWASSSRRLWSLVQLAQELRERG